MLKKDVLSLIGNTPLFNLKSFSPHLFAKLESFNVGGSIKDRIAKKMVMDAKANNLLKEGGVIIEPTSGNTGIGLALVGKALSHKVILTMPSSMSKERVDYLKALSADVHLSDKSLGLVGATDLAREILKKEKNGVILNQFENTANPLAHYETTGPEIYADLASVDIFVAGVGSGGTISGVGRFLKEKNPNIMVVAIEPKESQMLSLGTSSPHKIQGIGPNFVPGNFDRKLVDEILQVSSDEAFASVKLLREKEGLLCGISSGANLFGALALSKRFPGKNIVTVFPDGGEKYFSVEGFL